MGKLHYRTHAPEKNTLVTIHEEAYDEAKKLTDIAMLHQTKEAG